MQRIKRVLLTLACTAAAVGALAGTAAASTYFADNNVANYGPELMGDARIGTYWVSSTAPGRGAIAFGVDQGAAADLVGVKITPRPEYGPKTYVVETSDDGSSWTQRGRANAASELLATTTTFTTPVSARYVRVVVSDAWDPLVSPARSVQVAELELLAAPATPTARAFADTAAAPYEAALTLDGRGATYWVSDSGPSTRAPVAAGLDLGAAFPVDQLTVTPRADYGPKDYTVQTSTDGSSWTQRDSVTGASATVATTSSFSAVQARYVRVLVTDAYDPNASPARSVQIAELQVSTGPRLFADDSVAGYEPELMGDGSGATYWVSDSDPSAQAPIAFGIDQGRSTQVVGVKITPRAEYGPKTYVVETSEDGASWTQRGHANETDMYAASTTTFTAPVSARYVRVVVSDVHDLVPAPPRRVQVAELELLQAPALPTRRAFADTAIGPYDAALMLDGRSGTHWVSDSGPSTGVPIAAGVDLGAVFPVDGLTVTPRADYGPKDYAVETSLDGSSWTQQATVTGASVSAATASSFRAVQARYVRVLVTDAHDPLVSPARSVQIAELDVSAGPRWYADNAASGFGAELMADGNAGTYWVSASGPTIGAPISAGIDFGTARTVQELTVTPRASYGPKAYTVETSPDGATWTVQATVANASSSSATTSSFTALSTRWVRILVTDAHDPLARPARTVQVAELSWR